MDPARELAQLLDGELRLLARLGDQPRGARGVAREPRLGEAERERHGDHPLLGAVVEVALDLPALGVGGGDDALAGAAQVVDAHAQGARSPLFVRLAWEPDLAHPPAAYRPHRRGRRR